MPVQQTREILLTSKITLPGKSPNIVSRSRLDRFFAQSQQARLILLSAPAGFGKTTLLRQWISHYKSPVAWLTLEKTENSVERFLFYLIASVQQVSPELGKSALQLLSAPGPVENTALLNSLLADFQSLSGEFSLVLDDYHVINNPEIHALLQHMIDHLPSGIHIFLATRADPPLSLARLRVRQQLLEIRSQDLRFNTEETIAFLSNSLGYPLSIEIRQTLEKQTEGWAAGLHLAALSLRETGDPLEFVRLFTGSHRYILDYLMEEVLQVQSSEIQDFLMKTSILDYLHADLCASVSGTEESQQVLESLAQQNLFIHPLDNHRIVFRYHNLFSSLLRYRLAKEKPGETEKLHARASAWFAKEKDWQKAYDHALAAQDIIMAARYAELNSYELMSKGQINRLLGWFRTLPENIFQIAPALLLTESYALLSSGQFTSVEETLNRAESFLIDWQPPEKTSSVNTEKQQIQAQIDATRAIISSIQGDLDRTIALSESALKFLSPASNLQPGVLTGLGVAYRLKGLSDKAFNALEKAAAAARIANQESVVMITRSNQADLFFEKGQFQETKKYIQLALQSSDVAGSTKLPMASMALNTLAALAYEQDDIKACRQYLSEAEELNKAWGNHDILANSLDLNALLAIRQQQSPLPFLQQMETLLQNASIQDFLNAALQSSLLFFAVLRQEVAEVQRWLNSPPIKNLNTFDYRSEYLWINRFSAELFLWQRHHQPPNFLHTLIQNIKRFELYLEKTDRIPRLAVLKLLLAGALNFAGRIEESKKYLHAALDLANQLPLKRSILDMGDLLLPCFQKHHQSFRSWAYFDELYQQMLSEQGANLESSADTENPLSEREMEVLSLTAQGLSNQEIASTLILSTGTVKRHLHNIFNKLDAANRTEAIKKANESGWLK